jgi:hypothetical protein
MKKEGKRPARNIQANLVIRGKEGYTNVDKDSILSVSRLPPQNYSYPMGYKCLGSITFEDRNTSPSIGTVGEACYNTQISRFLGEYTDAKEQVKISAIDHDLDFSPLQVSRNLLVGKMLESLDQFSIGHLMG